MTVASTTALWDAEGRRIFHDAIVGRRQIIGQNLDFDLIRLFKDLNLDISRFVDGLDLRDTMWGFQLFQPELDKSLNSIASTLLDVDRWKWRELRGDVTIPKCKLRKRAKESPEDFEIRKAAWWQDVMLTHASSKVAYAARESIYNRKDVHFTYEIWLKLREILRRTGQLELFEKWMMGALPYLIEMHARGIKVDVDRLQYFLRKLERRAKVSGRFWSEASGGAAPDSWPQVHAALYVAMKLPIQTKIKRTKGEDAEQKTTADREALDELLKILPVRDRRARAIRALILYRESTKRIGYLAMLEGNRCYPAYTPVSKDDAEAGKRYTFSAATGRLTARNPPIQAWEKPQRMIFIPDDDSMTLLASDFAQQELRIMAAYAQDDAMMNAFKRGSIHTFHAELLGLDKTRAKNVVFGTIYRGGAKAAQHQCKLRGFSISLHDIEVAQATLASTYWKTWAWGDRYVEETQARGYAINAFGRIRYFYTTKGVFNEIINFPIQSTGADVMWRIIKQLWHVARLFGGALIATIHDETLFQVPKKHLMPLALAVQRIMEQPWPQIAPGFFLPVEMKSGPNWFNMTKLELPCLSRAA